MSRVDNWIIPRKRNRNRIKSTKGISQFHKLGCNNARKMLGEPMLQRVHLVCAHAKYYKKDS